jgi:hypothetical protein
VFSTDAGAAELLLATPYFTEFNTLKETNPAPLDSRPERYAIQILVTTKPGKRY